MKYKVLFIFSFVFFINLNCYRNPFVWGDKTQGDKKTEIEEVTILAINTSGEKFGAILKKGNCKEVVFIGDIVWGYEIKGITSDKIHVLSANGQAYNLYFD